MGTQTCRQRSDEELLFITQVPIKSSSSSSQPAAFHEDRKLPKWHQLGALPVM